MRDNADAQYVKISQTWRHWAGLRAAGSALDSVTHLDRYFGGAGRALSISKKKKEKKFVFI